MNTKHKLVTSVATLGLLFTPLSHALSLGKFGNTEMSLGGYVKFDAMLSSYSDGSLGAGNLGRDFYVPSLTPVGGAEQNTTVDMHARQTRFNFKTVTDNDGSTLTTFIELGFLATPSGNERITNSYEPRMRHAFIKYDNWLFGQTWSTFQNVGSLPETADFIGNTDFGIFARQAQVRYTNGNFQFALENPETTITPNGGSTTSGSTTITRIVSDDNELPDIVVRYNGKTDSMDFVVAALVRQLTYNDGASIDDSETSVGLSLTGKMKFGKDDLRFGLNTGSGMGRYIGLNVANGAVIDASGNLEAIDSTALYAAYRHFWNDKWRSNFVYSTISIDNDTALTGTGVTETATSIRVNLFYSPAPKLSFGTELTQASRELESGADGDMTRLQITAKLGF